MKLPTFEVPDALWLPFFMVKLTIGMFLFTLILTAAYLFAVQLLFWALELVGYVIF